MFTLLPSFEKFQKSNYLIFCPNVFSFSLIYKGKISWTFFWFFWGSDSWHLEGRVQPFAPLVFSQPVFSFIDGEVCQNALHENILEPWSLPLIFGLRICSPLAREWDQPSAPCEGSTPNAGLVSSAPGGSNLHTFQKAIVDHSRSFKKTVYFPSVFFSLITHDQHRPFTILGLAECLRWIWIFVMQMAPIQDTSSKKNYQVSVLRSKWLDYTETA